MTWVHIPLHSTIEAVGAALSLLAAAVLLAREDYPRVPHCGWLAAALTAMSLLDLTHACTPVGPTFSWSRTLPTLIGGVLAAGVWAGSSLKEVGRARQVAVTVLLLTLPLCAALLAVPQIWPPMFSDTGEYHPLAKWIDVGGGTSFLLATWFFADRYLKERRWEDGVFAIQTLLLGLAGLLFMLSSLWDPIWWLFHLLRLGASVTVLFYVIDTYRFQEERLRKQMIIEMEEQLGEIEALRQKNSAPV